MIITCIMVFSKKMFAFMFSEVKTMQTGLQIELGAKCSFCVIETIFPIWIKSSGRLFQEAIATKKKSKV